MFNSKKIKKLEAEVLLINKTLTNMTKIINEQQEKLNPLTFGGRKQG